MVLYRKVLRVLFEYYGFDPRGAESLFVHCGDYKLRFQYKLLYLFYYFIILLYIYIYRSWGSVQEEYDNITYLLTSLLDIGYQTYSYGIYTLFCNDCNERI